MILALAMPALPGQRIAPPLRGVAWQGGAHRVEVTCDACGARFERYASNLRRRNYCSEPCRVAGMRGPSNPKWRGGLAQAECDNCGKTFDIQRDQLQRGRGRFCSAACKWAADRIYPDALTARREHGRRREARQRAGRAIATHTFAEWQTVLAAAKGRCVICRRRRKLERDHVIPLSKGGTDAITNIQPVCKPCNCRKHNKSEYLL